MPEVEPTLGVVVEQPGIRLVGRLAADPGPARAVSPHRPGPTTPAAAGARARGCGSAGVGRSSSRGTVCAGPSQPGDVALGLDDPGIAFAARPAGPVGRPPWARPPPAAGGGSKTNEMRAPDRPRALLQVHPPEISMIAVSAVPSAGLSTSTRRALEREVAGFGNTRPAATWAAWRRDRPGVGDPRRPRGHERHQPGKEDLIAST